MAFCRYCPASDAFKNKTFTEENPAVVKYLCIRKWAYLQNLIGSVVFTIVLAVSTFVVILYGKQAEDFARLKGIKMPFSEEDELIEYLVSLGVALLLEFITMIVVIYGYRMQWPLSAYAKDQKVSPQWQKTGQK